MFVAIDNSVSPAVIVSNVSSRPITVAAGLISRGYPASLPVDPCGRTCTFDATNVLTVGAALVEETSLNELVDLAHAQFINWAEELTIMETAPRRRGVRWLSSGWDSIRYVYESTRTEARKKAIIGNARLGAADATNVETYLNLAVSLGEDPDGASLWVSDNDAGTRVNLASSVRYGDRRSGMHLWTSRANW